MLRCLSTPLRVKQDYLQNEFARASYSTCIQYIEDNRRRNIVDEIQKTDVSITKMKNKELKDWLYKIGITPRGKKEDFIRQFRTSMDNHQPSTPPAAHAMTDWNDDDIETENAVSPISRRNAQTPLTQRTGTAPLMPPTTDAATDSEATDALR